VKVERKEKSQKTLEKCGFLATRCGIACGNAGKTRISGHPACETRLARPPRRQSRGHASDANSEAAAFERTNGALRTPPKAARFVTASG